MPVVAIASRGAAIRSLTPAADPRKITYLRSCSPPDRRFSRLSRARADNPLRRARIGRRREPCAWRRRIDCAVGGYRWRRVGAERRDTRSVADAAGIGERPWIGWAERHARYRRVAGAGRAGWRRQLRQCPGGGDQGERREENERQTAGHDVSPGAFMQRSYGARVPCFHVACFQIVRFSRLRPATE
jgi:hypothetical protein